MLVPSPQLPRKLTLPSGTVVLLRLGEAPDRAPLAPLDGAPLFEETLRVLREGRVRVTKDGVPLDARTMVLRDFHVLRAVLTWAGILHEEEVEIRCRNCDGPIRLRPCAALEIGPWVFGELNDPELDFTLPFGRAIEVPALPLGRVRTATSITFEERTVEQAAPLFADAAAGTKEDLRIDVPFVRAIGVVAIGGERDPGRIADALAACDDAAFGAVAEAFLATHYPPRLAGVAFCKACGARNDVDAPYERELAPGDVARGTPRGHAVPGFPDFATFADRAREIARPRLLRSAPEDGIELVIEEGTPAVDDGGEPLLGSYTPSHPGDATTPSRAPVLSLYFRTFRALWDEEGPYEWDDELTETIEHELEHHASFLRGDDPTDDEERALIRDEAVRIVGRREAGRRELAGFGASLRDFAVRTWPLWVIAVVAIALALATDR